jgi:hypothetical protein
MIVALFGLCLAPHAWASCGDYLQHAVPPDQSLLTARDLDSRSPAAPRPDSAPPCRGPNCRSLPPVPAPSPAPVKADTSRDQALTCEILRRDDVPQTRQLPSCAATKHAGYPPLIERPPRPA